MVAQFESLDLKTRNINFAQKFMETRDKEGSFEISNIKILKVKRERKVLIFKYLKSYDPM